MFWGHSNRSKLLDILLAVMGVFIFGVGVCSAATITWQGGSSIDPNGWNLPENWVENAVPTITSDVIIPSGVSNYPAIVTSAEAASITIQNTAHLTLAEYGTCAIAEAGTVTVETGGRLYFNGGGFQVLPYTGTATPGTLTNYGMVEISGTMGTLLDNMDVVNKGGGLINLYTGLEFARASQLFFTNEGVINWNAGAIKGGFDIDASLHEMHNTGTINLLGVGEKKFDALTFYNMEINAFFYVEGDFTLANQTVFINKEEATFSIFQSGEMLDDGTGCFFNNYGIIEKTSTGDYIIGVQNFLHESGSTGTASISVTGGTLTIGSNLYDPTSYSYQIGTQINLAFGTFLRIAYGNHFLGSDIIGSGTLILGEADIAYPYIELLQNLYINSTTTLNVEETDLYGDYDIVVDGHFNWTGGTLHGPSTNSITLNNYPTISSDRFKKLYERKLHVANQTVLTLQGPTEFYLGYGAEFIIDPNAYALVQGDVTFLSYDDDFPLTFSNQGYVMGSGLLHFLPDTDSGVVNPPTFVNQGTVAPGDTSPGLLTLDAVNYTNADGKLSFNIMGTTSGEFDQFNVTGAIELGGILNVVLDDAYTPQSGDTFRIIDCLSVGTPDYFDVVNVPYIFEHKWVVSTGTTGGFVDLTLLENTTGPYRLNVLIDQPSYGGVTSVSGVIDCPDGACYADYTSGETVMLNPNAGMNYVFDYWTIEQGGTSYNSEAVPLSLSMTSDAIVTAHFIPEGATTQQLTVSIIPNEGGKVTTLNLDCPQTNCTQSYTTGTELILTASPYTGYVFDHWIVSTGAQSNEVTGSELSLTLSENFTVDAYFTTEVQPFTLNTAISPTGGGSIYGSGIECPNVECNQTYEPGQTVTLEAWPATGYVFDYWEILTSDGILKDYASELSLTMNENLVVTAYFKQEITETYWVMVEIDPEGSGSVFGSEISCPGVHCSGDYPSGTTINLNAYPSTGYAIEKWLISSNNETQTKYGSAISFMLYGNTMVTAVFMESTQPMDLCPNDPLKTDPGICGCGIQDTDKDSDGYPDCVDGCPDDPDKTSPGICGCGVADIDTDDDDTLDCNDGCPEDPNKTAPGECGCGVLETDADNDGVPDCNDECPDDPNKTTPGSCGCGKPETDADGDGYPDCIDECPNDPDKKHPGDCGCGVSEVDTDADGTPDCNDGCPNDPDKTDPGECDCGVSDTDTDADGTPDCKDGCPNDPDKIAPGECGCGMPETDSDDDQTPDCIDDCPYDPFKTSPGTCGCGVADQPGCIPNVAPYAPEAVGPKNESVMPDGPVTLRATHFQDPDGDDHIRSHWQIRRADRVYGYPDDPPEFDYIDMAGDLTSHELDTVEPGLKYYWTVAYADSGSGKYTRSEKETAFKIGESIEDDTVKLGAGVEVAQYRMVSFTQWPDDPTCMGVFEDELGGVYDTAHYRIGTYNAEKGGTLEFGDEFEIEPGRAYWILAANGLDITVNGVEVSMDHDIDLKLYYNEEKNFYWNMIACPNAANYRWEDIEVLAYNSNNQIEFGPTPISELEADNDYIDLNLWQWKNGEYIPGVEVMIVHEGYFMKVKRENVYLRFPVEAQLIYDDNLSLKSSVGEKSMSAAETTDGDTPPMPMEGVTFHYRDGSSRVDAGSGCFIEAAIK